VLTLALAGVEALQAKAVSPKYQSTNQVFNQTRKARHAQHVHHH
jgi:capsular polysaccharide biosynthesis protein